MADVLLEVRELVKRFGGNVAVDHASFEVERGSITGLIGPNGAGKSTCFDCVAGALRPDGGSVRFAGEDITGEPPHRVFHRGLARTFQIPQELRGMTVLENLLLVAVRQSGERAWESLLRPWAVGREERVLETRAREVLELVSLGTHAFELAGNLSGGQRKLLELARVLMGSPTMILLDEPSAGVNPTLTRRLVDDLRALRDQLGMTFLVIGHDMDVVARLCDRLIVMTSGRILVEGEPAEVLADAEVQEAYLGSQYR